MSYRTAIYYAPGAKSPLWLKAAQWLGRDALTGETFSGSVAGISRRELAEKSASARRYGFHATLKSPMKLAGGRTAGELAGAIEAFTATHRPFSIGRLALRQIGGFLALVPAEQPQALTDFAAEVVEAFEAFRAPVGEADKAKRNALGQLSVRQLELLDCYGYPYVMEQFQFHMTLTDRLSGEDAERFTAAALAHFGELATAETTIDRLAVFDEPTEGAPFERRAEYKLQGAA